MFFIDDLFSVLVIKTVLLRSLATMVKHHAINKKRVSPYIKKNTTELYALRELSVGDYLEMDTQTRSEFTNLTLKNGSVHVLHAGAGAGKTTLCTSLLTSIGKRYECVQTLALTFNVAAALEGRERNESECCTWQTIDSFIFALYKDDLKASEMIDLGVTDQILAISQRILGDHITPERAMKYGNNLESAFNSGNCRNLDADELKIFEAGLNQNVWWCHSLLRMRAKTDPTKRVSRALRQYNLIVVDEAQDINVVMFDILDDVRSDTTTVYVGDSAQSLYGFMSCVDVKTLLRGKDIKYRDWTLYVTFRFGAQLCDYINGQGLPEHMAVAHSNNPNTELKRIKDTDIIQEPHTVLKRRWGDMFKLAKRYMMAGHKVYIDAEKVQDIQKSALSKMPTQWDTRLFNRLSRSFVLDVISQLQKEPGNCITLSTVHGYKGLETAVIRVCSEVLATKNDDDRRLKYVALTRAKEVLYIEYAAGRTL